MIIQSKEQTSPGGNNFSIIVKAKTLSRVMVQRIAHLPHNLKDQCLMPFLALVKIFIHPNVSISKGLGVWKCVQVYLLCSHFLVGGEGQGHLVYQYTGDSRYMCVRLTQFWIYASWKNKILKNCSVYDVFTDIRSFWPCYSVKRSIYDA